MTNEEKQSRRNAAIEQMLAGWVALGRLHLADVPDDAPMCTALPSVSWLRAGTFLLQISDDDAEPTDAIRQLTIDALEVIMDTMTGRQAQP